MKRFLHCFFTLLLLVATTSVVFAQTPATIYKHTFGTTTITATPTYTVLPATGVGGIVDPNITDNTWTAHQNISSIGRSGYGVAFNLGGSNLTSSYAQVQMTIPNGYELVLTGYNFWRQRSNTGPQNVAVMIGATTATTAVGTHNIPSTGAYITEQTLSTPITVTGPTVTVRLNLTGATGTVGTFRLDDFELIGYVRPAAIRTVQNGPWDVGTTWEGGVVPLSSENAEVRHDVSVPATYAFTRDNSTVTTITSTGNLQAFTGLNFHANAKLNVSGIFTLRAGGYIDGISPKYLVGSTLRYDTGGTYNRNREWSMNGASFATTTTTGYPDQVHLLSTNLIYTTAGTDPPFLGTNSHLTIDAPAVLNASAATAGAVPALQVGGTLTVRGGLTLPNAFGRDLSVGADYLVANSATVNFNNRALFFRPVQTTHQIGRVGAATGAAIEIPYLIFDSSPSGQTVNVTYDLTLTAPSNSSVSLSMLNANDQLVFNPTAITSALIIGSSTANSRIEMQGKINNNSVSTALGALTINSSGAVGTLRLGTGYWNMMNFNVQVPAVTAAANLAIVSDAARSNFISTSALTNNTVVAITEGVLGVNSASNTLRFQVDALANPNAFMRQYLNTTPKNIHLSDAHTSAANREVSQVTISGVATATAYVDLQVADAMHPQAQAAQHISRYFNVRSNLAPSVSDVSIVATYWPSDVVGNAALMNNYSITNTGWQQDVDLDEVNNQLESRLFHKNTATAPNQVVPFFATHRPQEIAISVAPSTPYAVNSTHDFGTVEVGETATVIFDLTNTGGMPLVISGVDITGLAAPFAYGGSMPSSVAPFGGATSFTISMNATAVGVHTGQIIINSNDADEAAYVLNFTVNVLPAQPKIWVNGSTNVNSLIGMNQAPNTIHNTIFAALAVGSQSTAKVYTIRNLPEATINLLLTGSPAIQLQGAHPADFTVISQPSVTVLPSGTNVTFSVRFNPTHEGVRTAEVVFENNHSTMSPYRFQIRGTGTCPTRTLSFTPNTGPVGTWVRASANTGDLLNSTLTVDGISTPVTQLANNLIEFQIPVGATYGAVSVNQTTGCGVTGVFGYTSATVLTCAANLGGGGPTPSEIYISEVTDASYGGGTYIELTNPSDAPINLAGYSLDFYNNASPTINVNGSFALSGTIAPYDVFVVAVGFGINCSTPGGNGSFADLSTTIAGVNFNVDGNDHFKLVKSGTPIDEWGVYMDGNWASTHTLNNNGIVYRRNPDVSSPTVPFDIAEWTYIDWLGDGAGSCDTNDYTHIGTSNLPGTPPVVLQQPVISSDCNNALITIVAEEGVVGGAGLSYQWMMNVLGTATWTTLTNSGDFSGVTTAELAIANFSNYTNHQFYCLVGESAASCSIASQAIKFEPVATLVWDGSSWTPHAPTGSEVVQMTGNYSTAANGSFAACSMNIAAGVTVTVDANGYISIDKNLNLQATAAMNVVESGQFIQTSNEATVTNAGINTFTRTTSPFVKFDYTYWSSPVAGTTIASTFTGWRLDYSFYTNTSNFSDLTGANGVGGPDGHDDNGDDWVHYTGLMNAGTGYAVMGPTNLGTYPATRTVTFQGTYNTGEYYTPIMLSANSANPNDDYNLIGNPYPSAISADRFILANLTSTSGSLYFWTHSIPISDTLPGNNAYNFSTNDYAIYNLTGEVGTGDPSSIPNGTIAAGQGFMIEAETATQVYFSNEMRGTDVTNQQFYRYATESTTATQKDRFWLRVEHANGLKSETLLGYLPHATLGKDPGYDATAPTSSNSVGLYSLAESIAYKIQARPSFQVNDVVALGFSTMLAGDYSIDLTQADGLFAAGNQAIYLEDYLTGNVHDLREGAYTFTTTAGTFEGRFAVRYVTDSELGNDEFMRDSVQFMSNEQQLGVKTNGQLIESVMLFDANGKLLYEAKNIQAAHWILDNPNWARQHILVNVELANGKKIARLVVKY